MDLEFFDKFIEESNWELKESPGKFEIISKGIVAFGGIF